MGCRERPRGALAIPGTRPAGVFTAGTAQRYINMEGFEVGRNAVILGSGDIGLIMARRLTLEGAKVHAVAEIMPHSNGLARNIAQCLDDFGIPLLLSHTVKEIRGRDRVESVTVAKVDERKAPIPGTERVYPCDTLLLSVGLIPENELSRKAGVAIDPRTNGPLVNESMETSVPGVFACGNVVHVHDLVDFVTEEARRAGRFAARHAIEGPREKGNVIRTAAQKGVSYVIAQEIREEGLGPELELFFRVREVFRDAELEVLADGAPIASFRKRILAPGEMQRLVIDSALVRGKGYRELAVEVR
jgi:NADPH-dependent 2,4-dienoyl-CoA reductase/sulfur reductase-like enzyme